MHFLEHDFFVLKLFVRMAWRFALSARNIAETDPCAVDAAGVSIPLKTTCASNLKLAIDANLKVCQGVGNRIEDVTEID